MIPELRKKFNKEFSEEKYRAFVDDIKSAYDIPIDFRIAETPVFIPKTLEKKIFEAVDDIISTVSSDDYPAKVKDAIPHGLEVPNEKSYSDFLAIDFAICKDDNGELTPQLIELQGFPSLFFYQQLLNKKTREHFSIPDCCRNFFGGIDENTYYSLLENVILGNEDKENVVLLEIDPYKQKTAIDFVCTEDVLGIKSVNLTDICKEGKQLFHQPGRHRHNIMRIYNRVIFDELQNRTDLKYEFSFQDELDIEWIAHPNWFYKISKYSLPLFNSPYVPETHYLDKMDSLPKDLQNWILKPLFSFAGAGVKFDVTDADIASIKDKSNYILQRKVSYEPVIETPDEPAKAELRILCVYDNGYKPVNNLVRLSKGKMMGVDFNKNKTWVGSSIAYFCE